MQIIANGNLGDDREIEALNRSLRIIKERNEKLPSCQFITQDDIEEWDEVIVTDSGSNKLFAGIVDKVEINRKNQIVENKITVASYKKMLDRNKVVKAYTDEYAGDIVRDIVDNFTEQFTYDASSIADGPQIDERVAFNYEVPSVAIQKICDAIGYTWKIDFDKKVHFYAKTDISAPQSITEDSANFKGLKVKPDVSNFANVIIFRGGSYRSELVTIQIVADGSQTIFNLPEKPHETTVKVNGTSKTLGLKLGETTPNTEFILNYQEKYIENGTHAVLTSGDVLEVTFKYDVPLRIQAKNQTSVGAMQALFPGTNGEFVKVINDAEINSRDLAKKIIEKQMEAYSNAKISGQFRTNESVFEPGQVLTINTNQYSGDVVIEKVTTRTYGGEIFEYTIDFATVLFGFEDFLRSLLATQKVDINENEVIEKLNNFFDSLDFSESQIISTDLNRQIDYMDFSEDYVQEKNRSIKYVLGPYSTRRVIGDDFTHWPLNGDVLDYSGNGKNGTNYGVTFDDSGAYGQAGVFDGSSYADFGRILPTGSITLFFRMYVASTGSQRIMSQRGNNNGDILIDIQSTDSIRFLRWTGSGAASEYWITSSGSIQAGWNDIAIVYDGSDARIHINNSSETPTKGNVTASIPDSTFKIGEYNGAYFTGKLENVQVYNRALTSAEIEKLREGKDFYDNKRVFCLDLSPLG